MGLCKGVVHFKKKFSHPRCPCHSFFSRKEIKVFDENIPGFSPFNGLQGEPNGSRFQCKLQTIQRALNDSRQ